jgi:hypothetical protein
MIDIEKMSNDEFIKYREKLLNKYLIAGHSLTSNIECSVCDNDNNYTCFQCEICQIDEKEITL